MSRKKLSFARAVIAGFWFLLFVIIFAGGVNFLPKELIISVTDIQFVPILGQMLNGVTIAFFLFSGLLILSLLFGRIYCSVICPLGIFQDVIIRVSTFFRKNRKKRRYSFHKAKNTLRYTILSISVLSLLSGSLALWGYLDPYSIFGRIFSTLFRPLFFEVNNLLVLAFNYFENYSIHPMHTHGFSWLASLFSSVFLSVIIIMSVYRGRLFCNTICPVGAFLGLVSKFPIFRLLSNRDACINCKKCVTVCKAECIDPESFAIDYSRCILCFHCIDNCPVEKGITFTKAQIKIEKIEKETNKIGKGRRQFFLLTGAAISSLTLFGQRRYGNGKKARKRDGKGRAKKTGTAVETVRSQPILPPGALSYNHFTKTCISCHLCVSSCPTGVLQPSYFEYGLKGILMPKIDPSASFCNYDCVVCGEVCPTNAITELTKEEKRVVSIGKAVFHKYNCVVFVDGKNCGACAEHCPVKSVRMIPFREGLLIPEVDQSLCIGCSACEFICPTHPYKAIFVEPLKVHELAEKPNFEKTNFEIEEEFPF